MPCQGRAGPRPACAQVTPAAGQEQRPERGRGGRPWGMHGDTFFTEDDPAGRMAGRKTASISAAVDDASYAATEDEIREFLRSEAARDPDAIARFKAARRRSGTDHRPRIRAIVDSAVEDSQGGYFDAESYGDMDLDLSPVLDEARTLERRGNPFEAGRLYRHLSEVIAEYMVGFDDREGEFRDIFHECLKGIARCAKAGGAAEWNECIVYLVGRFVDAAQFWRSDYGDCRSRLDTPYAEILRRECRGRAALELWRSALTGQSGRSGGASTPVLRMKAYLAGRLGGGGRGGRGRGAAARNEQLAATYRQNADICAYYVRCLRREGNAREARRIAVDGARRFPNVRPVQSLVLSLCPKSGKEYRAALRRMFALTGSQKHLDELKRRSPRWASDRRALVGELEGNGDLLARVFDGEGMIDELARVAFKSDLLERYHSRLASTKHGPRMYEEYRKYAEYEIKDARRGYHYDVAVGYLRRMRSIPGHELKFERYVSGLRSRYGRRRALMERLDRMGTSPAAGRRRRP